MAEKVEWKIRITVLQDKTSHLDVWHKSQEGGLYTAQHRNVENEQVADMVQGVMKEAQRVSDLNKNQAEIEL